jgi:hypothetical protein
MNLESLEYRVDELEYQKLMITKKIRQLEFEKDKIRGKLEEVWDMIDGYKEKNEYGYSTLEGDVRVLKLPVIGSEKGIEEALSGKVAAGGGEDLETTRKYRKKKHREDAEMAANVMDGMNPEFSEEDEGWKLGRA